MYFSDTSLLCFAIKKFSQKEIRLKTVTLLQPADMGRGPGTQIMHNFRYPACFS